MTDLLDTVAELTHLRDKDDLELSFAQVIFGLAEASRVIVWRLRGAGTEARLIRSVALPQGSRVPTELPLASAPEYGICVQTRRHVAGAAGSGERHVFPITNDHREVTGLVELLRPQRLDLRQENAVHGLLRVYGNYVGLLDFGARDELTGLLNRRTFNGFFKQIIGSQQMQAVIAVADIDFFKRVNDEFGHPYGDEVLILMARLMERCFREQDGLFRFGGEEFLVVITNVQPVRAREALERFRQEVAATKFPQVGRVTVSIGFTTIRAGDTGAAAFGRADEALFVAKQRGRNQVQCHERLVREGSLKAEKKAGVVELF